MEHLWMAGCREAGIARYHSIEAALNHEIFCDGNEKKLIVTGEAEFIKRYLL